MKLTQPQKRVLRRVVKTNGGGVPVSGDRDEKVIMRLYGMGLVQGKAGEQSRAVHSTEGLELVRQLDAQAS